MKVLPEKLRRLGEMSISEIRFRAAQKLRIARERAATRASANGRGPAEPPWWQFWEPDRVPDMALLGDLLAERGDAAAERLPAYFAARTAPRFYFAAQDREALAAAHRRLFPGRSEEIRREADGGCAHRFRIFAYPEVDCGPEIPWRRDLIHGQESGLEHWSRVPYLDFATCGDSKIVWEPNRHQHFFTLGQAYLLTGDERYAEECLAQLENWRQKNPYLCGINWSSSLEAAFRAWSWLWAFHFLLGSQALTGQRLARLTSGLARHAEYIAANLSTFFSPNTHLLGEGFSLFVIGLLLPELRQAEIWRETGRKILNEEITRQVRSDGSHAEQSSYYHSYATDFFLCAAILAERNSCPFSAAFHDRLARMLDFLRDTAWPSGRHPMTGDADGGRVLALAPLVPNDFRAALSTGAAFFRRAEFRRQAGRFHEESLWLLGPQAADEFAALGPVASRDSSRVFADAGLVVMRSGLSGKVEASTQDSRVLFFDAGPQGMTGSAHGHCDALSILSSAGGVEWLVDPGTYVYTSSPSWRDYFRSTRAHNTAVVDSCDQAVPVDVFKWRALPQVRLERWLTSARLDLAVASHDGYSRLPAPIIHRRSVLYVKPRYWVVSDEFFAPPARAGKHPETSTNTFEVFFHFSPDVALTTTPGQVLAASGGSKFLLAAFDGRMELCAVEGEESPIQGWFSEDYGARHPAPVLVGRTTASLPARFHWLLWPEPDAAPRLREIAGPGLRLSIEAGGWKDFICIPGPEMRPSGGELSSDAEVAYVRMNAEDAPERISLFNGCCAEFAGLRLVAAESMLDELDVCRNGDRLEISARPARRLGLHAPGISEVRYNERRAWAKRRGDWLDIRGEQ